MIRHDLYPYTVDGTPLSQAEYVSDSPVPLSTHSHINGTTATAAPLSAPATSSHKLAGSAFSTHKPAVSSQQSSVHNNNNGGRNMTAADISPYYYNNTYNSAATYQSPYHTAMYYGQNNFNGASPAPYYDYTTYTEYNGKTRNTENAATVAVNHPVRLQYVPNRVVPPSTVSCPGGYGAPVTAATLAQVQPYYGASSHMLTNTTPNRRLKSPAQIRLLRQYYVKSGKPDNSTVLSLVKQTGLSRDEVKRWFRNERFKVSKQHGKKSSTHTSEEEQIQQPTGEAAGIVHAGESVDPVTSSGSGSDVVHSSDSVVHKKELSDWLSIYNDTSCTAEQRAAALSDMTGALSTGELADIQSELQQQVTQVQLQKQAVEQQIRAAEETVARQSVEPDTSGTDSVHLSPTNTMEQLSNHTVSAPITSVAPAASATSQPFSYNNFSGAQLANAFSQHKQLTTTYLKSSEPSVDDLAQSTDINDVAWRSLRRMLMPEAPVAPCKQSVSVTVSPVSSARPLEVQACQSSTSEFSTAKADVSSSVLDTFREMPTEKRQYWAKMASFLSLNGMEHQVNQLGFNTAFREDVAQQ